MLPSVSAFLTGLIDYAGLFPPAALAMPEAVRLYGRYRTGPDAWMLGPFICPAARLTEFADAAGASLSPDDPWPLSILIGEETEAGLDAIHAFLKPREDSVRIVALEAKASRAGQIDAAIDLLPDGIPCFFELPTTSDFRGLIAALAGTDHAAKVRTGGTTPDLFPSPETLARFIAASRDAAVSFKATAGLHHPLPRFDASVKCRMHGFFNVFGAAILAAVTDASADELRTILESENPADFRFDDEGWTIAGRRLATDDITQGRLFARSFGSCSFDEPRDDLRELNLLD